MHDHYDSEMKKFFEMTFRMLRISLATNQTLIARLKNIRDCEVCTLQGVGICQDHDDLESVINPFYAELPGMADALEQIKNSPLTY